MKKVLYPGTFDPITLGHLDIINRAASIFPQLIVAVVKFPTKPTLFSYSEREEMVKEAVRGLRNVKVVGFDGLMVEFAKKMKVKVILRGLRMISDFEYEFQMALTNRKLAPEIEAVFLMPHPRYSYISSRLIKEAAALGADLKAFLPLVSLRALKRKFNESSSK
ncbi:MAG: pantetheine-phosphate adenylyltransferase [Candidatus Omnitrophota bacterium]|nr:MAG: pantetheine-phosphate adenylyltransferase [Candidatus Omnitrophota bacterium]RKY46541.1 MAG: pantetheine-phosphate adenylyltransferase [Candidatus Omnitrophota bacterium]HDN86521.1 pantetheine-phosphate adenylyltransferase [Candidatus Omnitrophota bacterium]